MGRVRGGQSVDVERGEERESLGGVVCARTVGDKSRSAQVQAVRTGMGCVRVESQRLFPERCILGRPGFAPSRWGRHWPDHTAARGSAVGVWVLPSSSGRGYRYVPGRRRCRAGLRASASASGRRSTHRMSECSSPGGVRPESLQRHGWLGKHFPRHAARAARLPGRQVLGQGV